MPELSNGEARITTRDVYNLIGDMEARFNARLDRLDDKMSASIRAVDADCHGEIEDLEARINKQDGYVTIGAIIAAAISAVIGWFK